ncbi:hypothetical protein M1145_02585 [Patescibacteria group bacterium]|nr:hypothetical protein [Patescibacteria group bacterium]
MQNFENGTSLYVIEDTKIPLPFIDIELNNIISNKNYSLEIKESRIGDLLGKVLEQIGNEINNDLTEIDIDPLLPIIQTMDKFQKETVGLQNDNIYLFNLLKSQIIKDYYEKSLPISGNWEDQFQGKDDLSINLNEVTNMVESFFVFIKEFTDKLDVHKDREGYKFITAETITVFLKFYQVTNLWEIFKSHNYYDRNNLKLQIVCLTKDIDSIFRKNFGKPTVSIFRAFLKQRIMQ